MRRAQSLRHHARPSLTTLSDDLGVLKEQPEESPEDALRRQLLAAERENDKLKAQILALQDQLTQRPPIETIQELEKEYKGLDLILQGTLRENERCMAELERGKNREKIFERELARLAGDNWQTSLDIPANTTISSRSTFVAATLRGPQLSDASSFFLPQAESTQAPDSTLDESTSNIFSSPGASSSPSTPKAAVSNAQTLAAALSQIAQVRTLILGMEERMQARETRLAQEVTRAEEQGRHWEALKKESDPIS